MNRLLVISGIILMLLLQQCKVVEMIETTVESQKNGLEGYGEFCQSRDTIHSITISKADAIVTFQGDRYETSISLYHLFDSIIFITAVNSGYEIFRGSVDRDTIRIIDRINKTVYSSPMHKRFGYQHPVNFKDLEGLTSRFGSCDRLEYAHDFTEGEILFDNSEDFITKKVYLDSKSFYLKKFEFLQTRTNEYIVGEKLDDGGFRFFSNFLINDFEIKASGGEIVYNRPVKVNMDVNRKKYSFIEIQ